LDRASVYEGALGQFADLALWSRFEPIWWPPSRRRDSPMVSVLIRSDPLFAALGRAFAGRGFK
jgi:hypothetical protein